MDNRVESSRSGITRDIFLEAIDLSPAARRVFLDKVCASDPNLRQRVESFLTDHEKLAGFLDTPAARPTLDEAIAQTSVNVATEGDQLGPYTLLEQIGEGGAGLVFMAEQSKPVRRRVAIKVLKLGMDTRQVVARFEAERQALAMMHHKNIAAVFDAGATAAGRPYFVMELVRGTPVTTYCNQHNLSIEARLKLFIQICHALQHAHQKGVIHRDIKPSNILVTESEGGAVPKVIDFGIAKATEQPLTDKTLFTEFRSLLGTPAYMSPEQLDMAGADVDTRADIYSLGVLLYEMLTSQTPFAARELLQSGLDEFRRALRDLEPARPSSRVTRLSESDLSTTATQRQLDTRSLLRRLRGELDWIAMKCLEKDRSRRYATVNDLASDIERYLLGEPVSARPPSSSYRLQKFIYRNKIAVAAAGVVATALVTASIISLNRAAAARRAEQAATELRIRAEAEAARAQLNEYVADVTLAHQALTSGNFGRGRSLLAKHLRTLGKTDLRGFEWHYLSRLSQGDPHEVITDSGDSVRSVAFSNDGQWIAIGTRANAVVRNTVDFSMVAVSSGPVFSIAFAPDNSRVYIGDYPSIRVLNLDGDAEQTFSAETGAPIALSNDGRILAGGSREGVRLIDPATGRALRTLPAAFGPLSFSPDSKFLLTGAPTGFSLWPMAETSAPVEIAATRTGFFQQTSRPLAFSPDGRRIFRADNKILNVFDSKTGQTIGTIPADGKAVHSGSISAIALSPDGKTLATASWDHSIQLWDANSSSHLASLKGHLNEVWSVAFSPDGTTILSGAKDGGVFLWPVQSTPAVDFIPGEWQPVAFSPDEKTLVASNRRTGQLGRINTQTGVVEMPFGEKRIAPARGGPGFFGARISTDSNLNIIARQISEREIEILKTSSESHSVLLSEDEPISSFTLSPDGDSLVTCGWNSPPILRDLRSTRASPLPIRAARALFTTDSKRIVFLQREGGVTVLDAGALETISSFNLETSLGFSCALSPDNRILATAAQPDLSNDIFLNDIITGKPIGKLAGHKQGLISLAFTPDGKTLASSGTDGSLKLWNISTLQEILTFPVQAGSVVFSPNGRYVAFDARKGDLTGLQLLSTIEAQIASRK